MAVLVQTVRIDGAGVAVLGRRQPLVLPAGIAEVAVTRIEVAAGTKLGGAVTEQTAAAIAATAGDGAQRDPGRLRRPPVRTELLRRPAQRAAPPPAADADHHHRPRLLVPRRPLARPCLGRHTADRRRGADAVPHGGRRRPSPRPPRRRRRLRQPVVPAELGSGHRRAVAAAAVRLDADPPPLPLPPAPVERRGLGLGVDARRIPDGAAMKPPSRRRTFAAVTAPALAVLAAVVALPLLAPAPPADACGPYFPEPLFWPDDSTGVPWERMVDGELGILDRGVALRELWIAYRHLAGPPLTAADRELLVAFDAQQPASGWWPEAKPWSDLRQRLTWIEPMPRAWYETSRVERRELPDGSVETRYVLNCLSGAFETAAETLSARIDTWGADSPEVAEWVRGQDLVFANCGEGRDDPRTARRRLARGAAPRPRLPDRRGALLQPRLRRGRAPLPRHRRRRGLAVARPGALPGRPHPGPRPPLGRGGRDAARAGRRSGASRAARLDPRSDRPLPLPRGAGRAARRQAARARRLAAAGRGAPGLDRLPGDLPVRPSCRRRRRRRL